MRGLATTTILSQTNRQSFQLKDLSDAAIPMLDHISCCVVLCLKRQSCRAEQVHPSTEFADQVHPSTEVLNSLSVSVSAAATEPTAASTTCRRGFGPDQHIRRLCGSCRDSAWPESGAARRHPRHRAALSLPALLPGIPKSASSGCPGPPQTVLCILW